jgi:hypothetical protein
MQTVPLPTLSAAVVNDPFSVNSRNVVSIPMTVPSPSSPSPLPPSPFPVPVVSPVTSPSLPPQHLNPIEAEKLKLIELEKQRLQEEKIRLEQLRAQNELLKIQQAQLEEQKRLEEQIQAKVIFF